jgi:hypothetical protein
LDTAEKSSFECIVKAPPTDVVHSNINFGCQWVINAAKSNYHLQA